MDWTQTHNDIVDRHTVPVGSMATRRWVRRRRWELSPAPQRRYALSAFVGLDCDSVAIICWTCHVRENDQTVEMMATVARPYSARPVANADQVARWLRPEDVMVFAMWGLLVAGERSM